MNNTVIVKHNLVGHEIFRRMQVRKTKISKSILPDLIFPDCAPSLAIKFCMQDNSDGSAICLLEEMQKVFHNSYAIAIGFDSAQSWNEFQSAIEPGRLRIFRVNNINEAVALTHKIYREMNQKERFQLQTAYFDRERERLVTAERARKIMDEVMENLRVDSKDAQMLLDVFPTIEQLISAPKHTLEENSPASLEAIGTVASFFDG